MVPLSYIASAGVGIVLAVGTLVQFSQPKQSLSAKAAGTQLANAQTLAVASPHRSVSSALKPTGGGGIRLAGNAVVVPSHNPMSGELPSSKVASRNKRASIYTVREGDTLTSIAEMFDVSVDTIVWANDIGGETITPGDTLVVLPVSGVRHEVKKGETISELADRYGVSAKKIRSYNELKDNQLAVGAILDIPGGEMPEQSKPPTNNQRANVQIANQAVTPEQATASGYYTHPLPGSVRTQGMHGYNAIDFGAPVGSSIIAAASGRVEKSVPYGWNGGYGRFVVIRHDNGTKTLYAHMSDVIVSRGQRIAQGQVIGYVGDTGRSTGPHLHFEVRGARNPF